MSGQKNIKNVYTKIKITKGALADLLLERMKMILENNRSICKNAAVLKN